MFSHLHRQSSLAGGMSGSPSFLNLNYKIGLKREFAVKDDLNKYTHNNYDQLERKMRAFGKKQNRTSKVTQSAGPGLVKKIIKRFGRDGKLIMEEVIEKVEDTKGFYYEEPTDQSSLAKVDWASTPLYKHYLSAYQEDSELINFL